MTSATGEHGMVSAQPDSKTGPFERKGSGTRTGSPDDAPRLPVREVSVAACDLVVLALVVLAAVGGRAGGRAAGAVLALHALVRGVLGLDRLVALGEQVADLDEQLDLGGLGGLLGAEPV